MRHSWVGVSSVIAASVYVGAVACGSRSEEATGSECATCSGEDDASLSGDAGGDGTAPPVLRPGMLDVSFGESGYAETTIVGHDSPEAVGLAVAPNGNILVGGTNMNTNRPFGFVVQYGANGAADTSFGKGGYYSNPNQSNVYGMSLAADGSIAMAGVLDNYALRRLTSAGVLIEGSVTGSASAVVADPDGKLVLSSRASFSLRRLVSAGDADDTTFGTSGTLHFSGLPNGIQGQRARIVQQGTSYLLAAEEHHPPDDGEIAVVRATSDGKMDTSFGTAGAIVVRDSVRHSLGGVAIDSGHIYLYSGANRLYSGANGSPKIYVRAFDAAGKAIESFGTAGVTNPTNDAIEPVIAGAGAIAVGSDGKIVIGGEAQGNPGQYGFITRLTKDGALDEGFGTGGWVTTALPVYQIAIDANGFILAASGTRVARYAP